MGLIDWILGRTSCQKQLAEAQASLKACQEQLTAAQAENISLQAELATATAEVDRLTAENLTLADGLALANNQIADLEQQLDDCQNPQPPQPPPVPVLKTVLGGNTTIARDLGLASFSYLPWDGLDQPIADDAVFLHLKFARKGWTKGTNALWEEINAGQLDADITAWGAKLTALPGAPRLLALHHEPIPRDDGGGEGLPADLVAAVRRVATMFREIGVPHLMGQVLVEGQFKNDQWQDQLALDVADFVGVDGYGDARKGLLTAADVFDPALLVARAANLPLAIFETSFHSATVEQAQVYFESLDSWLKATGDVLGVGLYLVGDDAPTAGGLPVIERMAGDAFYGRGLA